MGEPMIISIDSSSPVPPFEQLRSQIVYMVASSTLKVGERLPSIRQLAGDLDLAPGTVNRAIRELEREGVVETRGRHGTFVLDKPRERSVADQKRELVAAAEEFAVRVRQLQVSQSEALDAARQALTDLGAG
jgi:GntR family transcriptional regulator